MYITRSLLLPVLLQLHSLSCLTHIFMPMQWLFGTSFVITAIHLPKCLIPYRTTSKLEEWQWQCVDLLLFPLVDNVCWMVMSLGSGELLFYQNTYCIFLQLCELSDSAQTCLLQEIWLWNADGSLRFTLLGILLLLGILMSVWSQSLLYRLHRSATNLLTPLTGEHFLVKSNMKNWSLGSSLIWSINPSLTDFLYSSSSTSSERVIIPVINVLLFFLVFLDLSLWRSSSEYNWIYYWIVIFIFSLVVSLKMVEMTEL